jgi:signal transduction histidine kinase
MSHELRTPLNAIAGYVDLLDLEVRGTLSVEQKQDLHRIKHSERSLLRLIDDVLDFAKIESGRMQYEFEDVRLDEFLGTLESFLTPKLGQKELTYSLDGCGNGTVVQIDRARVEQILLNLLSNAVKFTDLGSIQLICNVDDDLIRFQVRDTGCGIHPELLDSIFEPFVQGEKPLTRTMQGTGLGLAISRQLGRAMGGDVIVESTLGQGSTFTLVLPRRQ